MKVLANNKHVEYPQRIFEIGDVTIIDKKKETNTRDIRKIAVVITDTKVNYEEISSLLDSLLTNLGVKYKLKATNHPSFIQGRVAEILVKNKQIGFIGEIHPSVLENWNLEMPVAAFEISLEIF
jgi:phenylalanyl-tRNA synthetase beta chain